MAKLVRFDSLDNQPLWVNTETVRAVLPQSGHSLIVYGDGADGKIAVQGNPQTVAARMVG